MSEPLSESAVWEGTAALMAEHLGESAARLADLERRTAELKGAMVVLAMQQQRTLAWLEANRIVFDNLDDHWQKVALTLYTDLCRVDSVARNALAEFSERDAQG